MPAVDEQRQPLMAGETDLDRMLAGLTVSRRSGAFVVTRLDAAVPLGDGVEASIVEAEGVTVIATRTRAVREGWSFDFEAAWLTLDVHSSLAAVGLTAAVSAALAEHEIPCNVLAGYFHDHLLVPSDRATEALDHLHALATNRR